jgi:hypothetical protein
MGSDDCAGSPTSETKPMTTSGGGTTELAKGPGGVKTVPGVKFGASFPTGVSAFEASATGDQKNCRIRKRAQQINHLSPSSTALLLAITKIALKFRIINLSFSMNR